ncbi:type VI secretion system tip protein VgrG, partial [Xenorhabdus sp. Flor]|uniref:contractile injection system protein, VgrG/Pvc8 family n=1 Tax=Xenorhabdus cabanillasii TaxID=351673 RepID=UPI001982A6BB
LWRTTLRQNSRIFQQQDITTIITTILKEHNIRDVIFSLRHPHPAREFCVQYQESDFAFLQRLTAEEGIFYFFECSNGR